LAREALEQVRSRAGNGRSAAPAGD